MNSVSDTRTITGPRLRTAAIFMAVAVTGIVACAVAVQFGDPTLKKLIKLGLLVGLAVAVAVTKQPKRVLLFVWVVALTYNRQHYSFDTILGNYGSQGLYWVPADIAFFMLLAIWSFELVTGRQTPVPQSRPLWPWMLPFLAACTISAMSADHAVWSFIELVRLLKFGLILIYMRFNFRKTEWWTAVAGFGCAILMQSTLGVMQVAFNVGGSLSDLVRSETIHKHIAIEVSGGERRRAVGTMINPNILGPYLLLVVPVYFGLALTHRSAAFRFIGASIALIGAAAVGLTLSRLPWAVMVLDFVMLLICLALWDRTRVRSSLAMIIIGGFVFLLAMMPLADFIYDRFSANFADSIEFRDRYNHIALEMWSDHPMLGIGLNHFTGQLSLYDLDLAQRHEGWEELRKLVDGRGMAPVHNLYLLILAETGVLGVVGMAIVVVGVVITGLRAIGGTSGVMRGVCMGLVVGIVGQLIQQTMDFSLWVDPGFYTFAIIVGLLNRAPALVDEPQDTAVMLVITEEQ